MDIEQYETGTGGFVWKNIIPDELYSQTKFHVYNAFDMKIDERWSGSQFINHYNRIYYVKSGEAQLNFKDKEIIMKPGRLYLIPPYQLLSHKSKGVLHFSWVHFQAKLDVGLDLFMLYGKALEIDVRDNLEITVAFESLIDNCKKTSVSALFERNRQLLTILMPFLKAFDRNNSSSTKMYSAFQHKSLIPALNLINSNIVNPPDIKSLAKTANLSPEHFSRKFKSAFSVAPKRYILQKRIALAKQKLLVSDDSIETIGEYCGFCDIFHFSRIFKQETGVSPSLFRKNYDISKLLDH